MIASLVCDIASLICDSVKCANSLQSSIASALTGAKRQNNRQDTELTFQTDEQPLDQGHGNQGVISKLCNGMKITL